MRQEPVTFMDENIFDKFVYEGFGFPVTMRKVPMILNLGTWTPNLDSDLFSRLVARSLISSDYRFTGHQVLYLRSFLDMRVSELAKALNVRQSLILRWESSCGKESEIPREPEQDLRLVVAEKLYEFAEDDEGCPTFIILGR